MTLKVAEVKREKRQESTFLDVLFSSFKRNDLPIIDIIPYKRITKEGYLIDKQNEYQAFLKVKTTDLVAMNNTDLNRIISQLTSLVRVYTEPLKIVSMTYLTETSDQQTFWKGRINKYRRVLISSEISPEEREKYETMLNLAVDNLRRVTWVEDSLTELTFFIVAYGKNKKEIENRIRDLVRLGGKQIELKQSDAKELEQVIFRLNNMNTEM